MIPIGLLTDAFGARRVSIAGSLVVAAGAMSSGRARATTATISIVITASPSPMTMCTPPIAASTVPQATTPDAASCPAQASAAAMAEHHAANPVASNVPCRLPPARRRKALYTA